MQPPDHTSKQMKYFISHSSKDKSWADQFIDIIVKTHPDTDPTRDIFYSSVAETGSDIKETILNEIDKNLAGAETIILAITNHYLRSSFCLYELCSACFYKRRGKNLIILIQNQEVLGRLESITKLFPGHLYVVVSEPSAADTFLGALCKEADAEIRRRAKEDVLKLFADMENSAFPLDAPYIGMSKTQYNRVFSFPEKYGVEFMTFGYPCTPELMAEKAVGAKEIIFVSTTGSGFLKTYKTVLAAAVKSGAKLSVVMADRNSEICNDLSAFEVYDEEDHTKLMADNCQRIANEFDASVQYLNEIYVTAHKKNSGVPSQAIGTINCCPCYTLIRQTALAIRYDDDSVWGWITCTMPPERSADNTPSFVLKGDMDSDVFAGVLWRYCSTLVGFAEGNGKCFAIDGRLPLSDFGTKERKIEDILDSAKAYWEKKQQKAKEKMADKRYADDDVLIEVAAQHPLKKRRFPNVEFSGRLDKAIELYHELTEKGLEVSIYVPGSRHTYKGVADEVSLSEAGCEYLRARGIPESALLGEDANEKYKGDQGVYNSADECFVASEIFKNGPYGQLICICSPNQIMRKTMYYLEFECIPQCYGVTTPELFHGNIVNEIFGSLNTVLYEDHSWQEPDSECFINSRRERKPRE